MKPDNRDFLKTVVSVILLGLATAAPAGQSASVSKGDLTYVVCSNDSVRVRSANNLSQIIFSAQPKESVKMFQGWGENKKSINVGGQNVSFVRVQFDDGHGRPSNIGYVGEQFIKLKSQCGGASAAAPAPVAKNTQVSGNCCRFPINHEPNLSYTTGERQFGALRDKGRIHAAVDLYGNLYEPVVAVGPGVVVRGLYDFYLMTYAVDVKHPNFVARYGEVSGKRAVKAATGDRLAMGETVAHMGQCVPRIRPPMLHFEMYRGTLSGPLSTPGANKYGRRRDLINPTPYVQQWENKTF